MVTHDHQWTRNVEFSLSWAEINQWNGLISQFFATEGEQTFIISNFVKTEGFRFRNVVKSVLILNEEPLGPIPNSINNFSFVVTITQQLLLHWVLVTYHFGLVKVVRFITFLRVIWLWWLGVVSAGQSPSASNHKKNAVKLNYHLAYSMDTISPCIMNVLLKNY